MNAPGFPLRGDAATIHRHCQIIHDRARHALRSVEKPGRLPLVIIRPDGGPHTVRFALGDVDGMARTALDACASGQNVYVEPRTIAEHATSRRRYETEDTRGVFAFVVDADHDKGKGGHVALQPSLRVESSPGNAHLWYFLDRALTHEQAQPKGEAIRAATGADSATGVVTQPYRLAGTPNYPNARKRARGRIVTPTRILDHRTSPPAPTQPGCHPPGGFVLGVPQGTDAPPTSPAGPLSPV